MKKSKPILFFDGHCNLCNSFIDFLVRYDPNRRVLIASLQGKTGAETLSPEIRENMKSVVLLDEDKMYEKSAAIFRVSRIVQGPFVLLLPFWILPRPLTNWIYDWVAGNRYRLFGKHETCRIPSEDEKSHFLP